MTKKLVLVVHGIGEQSPGETLNQFVGGVTGRTSCTVNRTLRHLDDEAAEGIGSRNVFPCHHAEIEGARAGDGIDTVMAEVYWADLSPTPAGRFTTVIALLQVTLSMTNFIRENARYVLRDWPVLRLVPGFASGLVVGPFAALNAMLAIGALVVMLLAGAGEFLDEQIKFDLTLQRHAHIGIGLASIAAMLTGAFWRFQVKEKLFALFNVFLIIWGGIFLALVLFTVFVDPTVEEFRTLNGTSFSNWIGPDCSNRGDGHLCDAMDWYIFWGLVFLEVVWVFVMVGLLATLLLGAAARFIGKRRGGIFPAMLSGQITFWLMLTGSIWGALSEFGKSVERNGTSKPSEKAATPTTDSSPAEPVDKVVADVTRERVAKNEPDGLAEPPALIENLLGTYLDDALLTLPLVWVYVILLVLTAFGIFLYRIVRRRKEVLKPVVLNRWMNGMLISIGIVMSVVAFVLIAAQISSGGAPGQVGAGECFGTEDAPLFSYAFRCLETALGLIFGEALAITLLVGAFFAAFWKQVAQGVGLARDISSYFLKKPGSSSIHKREEDYVSRTQMHARLRIVLNRFLIDYPGRELIIVSHSQGTVIAIEALRELATEGPLPFKGGRLVTMGSPYAAIYDRYFNIGHPASLRPHLADWKNIYRTDDFVGTTIKAPTTMPDFPKNIPVPPKGHTGYWTDPVVLMHLRPMVL